jgi:hypothetical protein
MGATELPVNVTVICEKVTVRVVNAANEVPHGFPLDAGGIGVRFVADGDQFLVFEAEEPATCFFEGRLQ